MSAKAILEDDMRDYAMYDSDDSEIDEQWRDFSEGVIDDDSQFLSTKKTTVGGGGGGGGKRGSPRPR